MADVSMDFEEDFLAKYSEEDYTHVKILIDSALEGCQLHMTSGNWSCSYLKERHDALNNYERKAKQGQLSHFIDVDNSPNYQKWMEMGWE